MNRFFFFACWLCMLISSPVFLAGHTIKPDTLFIARGTTYRYTVDTPEGQGLVSTVLKAGELLEKWRQKAPDKKYQLLDAAGLDKKNGELRNGDQFLVLSAEGKILKTQLICLKPMALNGWLSLDRKRIATGCTNEIVLSYTAGQRSPDATLKLYIPRGIDLDPENAFVNVIGRGEVTLKDLEKQSVGRIGSLYPYRKVGTFRILKKEQGTELILSHLDLRPLNGADLVLRIGAVHLSRAGKYMFRAVYTTSQPEILTSSGEDTESFELEAVKGIVDFRRLADTSLSYIEKEDTYTRLNFKWTSEKLPERIVIQQSSDQGKTWSAGAAVFSKDMQNAKLWGLKPNQQYLFRLLIPSGENRGFSNTVSFYSGKLDVRRFGVKGNGSQDETASLNLAIDSLSRMGGGTLVFNAGTYLVKTVQLKSNVYLYLEQGAVIKAIKGADAPETTWFSDQKYRSGLSPTDTGPYADPENYMTKQDVGHHYFRNSMFFGERLDNVKIIGQGTITGDGNLVNGDKVMNNAPDNRADKMFTLKLCTNVEIGGIYHAQDLWYDEQRDEPYYIGPKGQKLFDSDHMLKIERSGHFALLATGTDGIHVHDTYFGKNQTSNARDIYDFMGCNRVRAVNIYSKVSSDDIIKPGSDCSLGFTRPASDYKVRNIIGDTNCNLFQIGSETADDITKVCVDNIYVLGANKAGFSISTNDGGRISDIHLNCGHTGPLHSRSKMYRAAAPFFISISNRGRILGAQAARYRFTENGRQREELLIKNVNIGEVNNISLKGIDVQEVYGGSSYNKQRWKAFDGTQSRSTPIVAGYKLPGPEAMAGGLDFKLPNGKHTGYIKNISFEDVHIKVKGGNTFSDAANVPPELGVGQYNASNLKVQPSYGLWARHVNGLNLSNCSFSVEQADGRYVIVLDDVNNAEISLLKTPSGSSDEMLLMKKNSSSISVKE